MIKTAMEPQMNLANDKVSILAVDDDEKNLMTLEAVLGDLGLDVVCVRSGSDALRKLLTENYALILLDVNMPGMDGFETASLIRQRQNSETTPIIFITAYGDELFMERGYSLGAVDFILTPIVTDVLRTKVSVFVELYRQTEQIRRQADRLQQRSAQLSALANQLTDAEHRERRRLAQVLHDHLQQLLVAAKMRLSTVRPIAGSDRLLEALQAVDRLLDESISTSRSLTVELSPPILHDGGLGKAMEWLARKFETDHRLHIHLETPEREPRLPAHVLTLLYQAIRELLFNIVKHANVSEAWVRIDQVKDNLRVVVEDRGAGFQRPADRSDGGTDHFGLFSIRERLVFLGGSLDIQSAEGQGTRITITTPTEAEGAPSQDAEQAPAAAALPPALRNTTDDGVIRVLLADDHEILRKGLAGLLNAHDDIHVIAEASDGEQALTMALELGPDVVVMDIAMPRLSGLDATRRIVAALPEVQVIGLSMHDTREIARAVCDAGAVSYLNKAGPPDQLVAAIRATRTAAVRSVS